MDKLSLLKQIVSHLESVQLSDGPITQEQLEALPFAKAKLSVDGRVVGIKKDAAKALHDLTNEIFKSSARYLRGTKPTQLLNEISDVVITNFAGRNQGGIGASDVGLLESKLDAWFTSNSATYRFYVPCAISPWRSPPFDVGPVSFSHLSDFAAGEGQGHGEYFDGLFGRMFEIMRRESALWMATIETAGCTEAGARELADVAVDIALASLQLVVPLDFSRGMTRMTARALPRFRAVIARRNGAFSHSTENLEPGLSMGEGILAQIVTGAALLLRAAGNHIAAYVEGRAALTKLEQAWIDAAYWFHEGLAEPLDTIAVAKLETCIEVLLRAENIRGSKARLLKAIETFYGKGPKDFTKPGSNMTVEQFVERLVEDRSRVLHGTWSTLTSYLRDSRPNLTFLALELLANYTIELDTFMSGSAPMDNIDTFLDDVVKRRTT